VVGAFQATGIRPRFLEQLRVSGVNLPNHLFDRVMEVK
jgi:pilus assembly protein CpaF